MPPSPDAPERLDRFMARAASAYYAGRDPFGPAGDFTTAPEITQAFGECLGLWAAVTWEAMGRPDPVILAEAGPGRGTLMADALRAAQEMAPAFHAALRVHLVETSPRLRAAQAARFGPAVAGWHDDLAELPPGPMILLANEFLDALPIRQFVRRGQGWVERFVAGGAFVECPAPLAAGDAAYGPTAPAGLAVARDAGEARPDLATRPHLPAEAPEGAVQEICEPALALIAALAARLAAQGGAALFLDYGPAESAFGDSLQAVSAHGAADPLGPPGSADITAHVDFAALARLATETGARAWGPIPQGLFLARLGLASRAAILARLDPARAGQHLSAAQRLTAPEQMGRLFKALCLCHPGLPPPAFEDAPWPNR